MKIMYCPKCQQFLRNPGHSGSIVCCFCGSSLNVTDMDGKDYDAMSLEEKEQWKKEYAAAHLPSAFDSDAPQFSTTYQANNWANVILFAGWIFIAIVAIGAISMFFNGQFIAAIVTVLGGLLLVSGFMMMAEMAHDLRLIRYYMDEYSDKHS